MDMGVYKVAAEMWGDKQDEDGGQQMLQNSWKQMISICIQKEVIVYLMTSEILKRRKNCQTRENCQFSSVAICIITTSCWSGG